MMDASSALRTAVIALLRPVVSPAQVYSSRAPQDAPYPYVVVGDNTLVTTPSLSDTQRETTRIYVYSSAEVDVEVRQLCAKVRATLHEAKFGLLTGHVAGARVRSVQVIQDSDGRTFNGVVTFESLLQD